MSSESQTESGDTGASSGLLDASLARRERRLGVWSPDIGWRLPGQGRPETPPALRREAGLELFSRILPALASGLAVALGPAGWGVGLLTALAVYVVFSYLLNSQFPLRLIPVSRVLIALLGPALGAGIVSLSLLLSGYDNPEVSFGLAIGAGLLVRLLMDVVSDAVMARNPIRIAVVGSPVFAAALERELEETGTRHIELLGWINLHAETAMPMRRRLADRITDQVAESKIDLLVFGPATIQGRASHGSDLFHRVADACVDVNVRLIAGNQFYERVFGHVPMGTIDSAWYLHLVHPEYRPPGTAIRRLVALVASVPIAILAAPLIGLAAIAIKLQDRGPVFYRQVRIGERGKEFEIVKLRSMRIDAEAAGIQFAQAGDSRVTLVGRFLRRTHLDELPQIWNVLRGDMTLVGPRPERPEIVTEMETLFPHYQRRHNVKPGVSGWAQVRCGYAGSTLGTAWKLCHDLYYLKHRSLLDDILIVVETLAISVRDAHRPMRAPDSQFIFGVELGIDAEPEEKVVFETAGAQVAAQN